MNRRLFPVAALLASCLVAAGCSACDDVGPPHGPERVTVNRAATLAFGKATTCGKPDPDGEYTCAEHPPTCDVQTDGWMDGFAKNAGCWETICDVELGVPMSHGEPGRKDFYFCERLVIGCSSMEGGCPSHDVCITGRRRKVAIDVARTAALPGNGRGQEFSCPYHDEG
jgi:hypothetical protein